MRNYFNTLFITLLACFGAQSLALHAVGGKTTKSESNYFSSLARIQTGTRDSPSVMLVGSSITGRLPDRANGFKGIANMGCDGGSAVDVLRAMDQGILPIARLVIIEGNTLGMALNRKETEIAKAMKTSWFAAGRKLSSISATARPAAFFYSKLLAGKIGANGRPDGESGLVSTLPTIPASDSVTVDQPDEQKLIDELSGIIGGLRERGTICWVVIMPPKIDPNSAQHHLVVALAAKAQVKFWDLGMGIPTAKIQLTDGIHMAPESAALTVRELVRAMNNS